MKGHFYKDLLLLQDFIIIFLSVDVMFAVFIGGILIHADPSEIGKDLKTISFSLFILLNIVQLIVSNSMVNDSKSGYLYNVLTQPLPRKNYIISKYCLSVSLSFLFTLILVSGGVVGIAIRDTGIPEEIFLFLAGLSVVMFFGMASLSVNSVSIFMKFGNSAGFNIWRIFIALPQLVLYGYLFTAISSDGKEVNMKVPLAVAAVSVLMSIILLPLGLKWTEKKEL